MFIALILALATAGCGDSDDDSATAREAAAEERLYPWLKGPTREFLLPPGGDNVVQTFGEEGTSRERAEATAVIAAWLRARAAKDWARDCSFFSRPFDRMLTEDANTVTKGRVKTCAEALAYFKGHASGDFRNTLGGSQIDSLRVGEGQKVDGNFGLMAFAQYHGTDGKDWVVPLEREGGEWKIAKAGPINRLR
ncbi:MAG TPA: hypothetical protein VD761_08145 [Solirubrobacterales bacterium]|nr:hypothetical protein [Solirubrobacterales bacterium]